MNATRTCSIEGCDGTRYCRGWCAAHYERWRVHGDPNVGGLVKRQPPRDQRSAVCTVVDCTAPSKHRNLCTTHYHRWKRHGDVERGRIERTTIERFMSFVEQKPDGCWQWTGAVDAKGYGQFQTDRRVIAHRWSYEHHVAPIPDGLTIDHLCRNTGCVNPEHMEPVTRDENLRREHAARRTA